MYNGSQDAKGNDHSPPKALVKSEQQLRTATTNCPDASFWTWSSYPLLLRFPLQMQEERSLCFLPVIVAEWDPQRTTMERFCTLEITL